jgi:hypothetical protein
MRSRESYVRPVTAAREPAPEWHAVWRFRAVALVLLAVLAVVTTWAINMALHVGDQDPTSGVPAPVPSSAAP